VKVEGIAQGEGKAPTIDKHIHTTKQEGGSEGAGKAEEDRSRVCHTCCREWRVCGLAASNGGPGSSRMNTSAQEHSAQQQHQHHGVEGNTKPHTGPKAFAAMKQDEARKQSTTTPQAKEQGNRAVA